MIKGMTGFGSVQFLVNRRKVVVEIKSLNGRYFDLNYYLPNGFSSIEGKIKNIIQKDLKRGRINVSLHFIDRPEVQISLNKEVVKAYMLYAKELQKDIKLENDLKITDIINAPGVLEKKDVLVSTDAVWESMLKALKKSLYGLLVMRKREGKDLAKDVSEQLKKMAKSSKEISLRVKVILKGKKKILTNEEFQSFQKNDDVNEEISRLNHYIDEVKKLLKNSEPVGKRIDFIAQEMQRETNTIGSKIQDTIVSNAVISLKSKIEKIREQSQNIE